MKYVAIVERHLLGVDLLHRQPMVLSVINRANRTVRHEVISTKEKNTHLGLPTVKDSPRGSQRFI